MRIKSILVVLVATVVCGCSSSDYVIRDCDLYATGKLKREAVYYSEGKFEHLSEYFENGRLRLQQWSARRRPLVKLTFYENGRLKSEERFFNGELTYGVYYTENGVTEQTIGRRNIR
jgi:antitoxin component YwqK of YwqJK toxin-antitoxin module